MNVCRLGFVVAVLLLFAGGIVPGAFGEEMQTAPHVDLNRYQGRWYEIVRLPLHWEDKCASDVTATYTLRSDGKFDVLNQCKKADGSSTQSHGTAKLATKDGSNSKLKVTFFWPFRGDYWILDLDPSYQWTLVGTPNKKNLWVLSRMPSLDKDVLERLVVQAKQLGFDTSKLIYTRQD
jgi:apolipoprotein D and lipocalin family protein